MKLLCIITLSSLSAGYIFAQDVNQEEDATYEISNIKTEPIKKTADVQNGPLDIAYAAEKIYQEVLFIDDIVESSSITALANKAENLPKKPIPNEIEKFSRVDSSVYKDKNLGLIGYIIFLLTLISLLVVTALLFKEIKWRKRHTKNESIVFPNAHLDFLEDLRYSYERLYGGIIDFGNASVSSQKNTESLIAEMIKSMTNLNSTIDSQNKEIDKLKEGYDFTIKKNSILPLIELNELVQNFLNDNKHTEETINTLIKVKAYLSSYLEEMDVYEFEIKPGKSTRELSSEEFEIDSVETTEDGNLQDKVVLTSKKGYENIHPNGKNILVKAKVKVYKKEKKIG